ncbi:PREDICTED: uncharacterized protein LOC104585959 [Nelumbo nucifera]|uniref:Uncharacterized protein LOC104585959 n=1 Tax=Nelumbo nucifera TaxID=4432 RepID=A0A1U7YQV9_NELNU|nr:PREDICTED: uncharacterized protein LOC104585959 [Nelumbo nucifera]
MGRKRWSFKNLGKYSWPWRFSSSAFRWRRLNFHLFILDDVLFKIISVFEAIILVSTLCFFYLCCGCHF